LLQEGPAFDPTGGVVIQGTGGLRKLRWAAMKKGIGVRNARCTATGASRVSGVRWRQTSRRAIFALGVESALALDLGRVRGEEGTHQGAVDPVLQCVDRNIVCAQPRRVAAHSFGCR